MDKPIIFLLLALLCIVGALLTSVSADTTTETTDCYDENHHKINELTCEQEVYDPTVNGFITFFSITGIVLMFVAFITIINEAK